MCCVFGALSGCSDSLADLWRVSFFRDTIPQEMEPTSNLERASMGTTDLPCDQYPHACRVE
jgi:hypothetical protein